jgi:hypothetical protein
MQRQHCVVDRGLTLDVQCKDDRISLTANRVRKWWLEDTQQTLYPNLSKMALDILSIPAMSAEPERLFSDTKITLQDRRNRLGIGTIEAIECIKSWSRTHNLAWVDDVELVLDTAVMGENHHRGLSAFRPTLRD